MRVLLLGATGFIGRHLCARLIARGHEVVGGVRNPDALRRRFPNTTAMRVDMNQMTAASAWQPILHNVDAVVNCAGILQSTSGQSAEAIHWIAPKSLFDACANSGLRKVVQISAVSADADTEYARTKKAADDYLRTLDLDWIVLRPSLVYAQGSYGGSSLLRGLAGFPFVTPVIGDGQQPFQPIHADDLAETVARCLENEGLNRTTLEPVGPENLTTAQILIQMRAWLDLGSAPLLHLPMPIATALARIGDLFDLGPIKTTALKQLIHGNASDASAFQTAIGFRPRTMREAFTAAPSHVQDRWHARLYFLRPALTLSLCILWLLSGISGLVNFSESTNIARTLGLPSSIAAIAVTLFCLMDFAIAFGLARSKWTRGLGVAQLILVSGYTAGFGIFMPDLWLDPLGRLLKNLPIIVAIGLWIGLQDEK